MKKSKKVLLFLLLVFLCLIEVRFGIALFVELFKLNLGGAVILAVAIIIFGIPIFFIFKSLLKVKEVKNSSVINIPQNHNLTPFTSPIDSYVDTGNVVHRVDGKPISDEEVPYLIQKGAEEALREHAEHLSGKRDISIDHRLTEDETKFFNALALSLKDNGFNPSELRLRRLGNRTFNVDYVSVGYLGKIQLTLDPGTNDKYAILKNGRTRALRVLNTQDEAEEYVRLHGGDEIEFRPGIRPYYKTYMQYFRGLTMKELFDLSPQECIDTIPRWIAYIKYCKRSKY